MSGTTSSANGEKKKIKFLQLYTSKSFDERRSELVLPPSERKRGEASVAADDQDGFKPLKRGNSILSPAELEKHVLSPRLVEAISSSAAVVWANCDESGGGGLIGRSDMHLQTAVGIPVAIDDEGNMCIVVMFSPKNMQSSDDAMEYLKAVSKSATSSSIPCLLPVVDRANNRLTAQPANESKEGVGGPSGGSSSLDSHNVPSSAAMHVKGPDARQDFGHGVKARFVSLTEDEAEIRNVQDVTSAPKDCYGIPMLPSFAELGSSPPATTVGERPERDLDHDAFDEASYGVWSTVMGNVDSLHYRSSSSPASTHYGFLGLSPSNIFPGDTDFKQQFVNSPDATSSKGIVSRRPFVQPQLKIRLEEFLSAFLGMSVFDLADVWIPCSGEDHDTLAHVTSVIATNSIESDEGLEFFRQASQGGLIKKWSGAVGRAYGSGSPVWTTSRSVFADSYRSDAFETARVQTALAVPILSAGTYTPACIICCYSQVREVSVPFVLKFLQQALRLVWGGLDRVEPHESVGKEMWNDVAPADLGEMAADVEMQQAFLTKKRPHDVMASSVPPLNSAIDIRGAGGNTHERKSSLTLQLESLQVPQEDVTEAQKNASPPRHALEIVVQEAVRSVENVVLWSTHQAVATNEEGTKRAHITATEPTAPLPQFPQYPPPTTSVKEDPAVAIANIKEFNTMAMHGISQQTYQETSSSSQAWVSNPIPDQASSGGHLGRISSMPLQCQPVAFGGPSQENAILGAKVRIMHISLNCGRFLLCSSVCSLWQNKDHSNSSQTF